MGKSACATVLLLEIGVDTLCAPDVVLEISDFFKKLTVFLLDICVETVGATVVVVVNQRLF